MSPWLIIAASMLLATAANATLVDDTVVSLEVPDEWVVSGNGQGTTLAVGKKIVDQTPLPFLSIQTCTKSPAGHFPEPQQCRETCGARSIDFLFKEKKISPSPVHEQSWPAGVMEYHTEAKDLVMSAQASVFCAANGSVYISLVTDEPLDVSRAQFARIVKSLNWK